MVFAQQRTITGNVTSKDDGSTLPGVTVVVKGTTNGAVTDVNGKYTIIVPAKYNVLVFSFVGMKPYEANIDNRTNIDVVLETDVMNIEGVVVTAIGISRETKALGYSVQEVGGENLQKTNDANLFNSLNGKVAGVSVTSGSGAAGGSTYFTIRGAQSIGGNNQPLIVVDGVPIDNSQYYSGNPDDGTNNLTEGVAYSNRGIDLNPEDIASVSVLKGGAATALYGLRAASGVVLINTKKGQAVKTSGNTYAVSFASSFSIEQVNKLPEIQKKYGQGLNGNWAGPHTANRNSWGPLLDTCRYTTILTSPSMDPFGTGIYPWDKHGIIVGMNDPNANPNKIVKPYDNLGTFFETGHTWNNSLGISGGNPNATYYVSIGNLSSKGIVPNNTFNKTTVKIAGQAKLSDKFFTSGSVNYINSGGNRIQQGSNLSGVMLGLLRTPVTFDNSNGYSDPVDTPEAYQFEDGSQRAYRGFGIYDNPYWTVNQNSFKDQVNRMIGSAELTYNPLSWLNATYRIGTDFYTDRRKGYFAINSSAAPEGQVQEDQHFNRDINGDLIINMKHDISKDFKFDITIGHNFYQTYHQQLYTKGDQLAQPDFYHISNAAAVSVRELIDRKRTQAVYGDLGLSYQSMVFLNITGRNEWSTALPKEKRSFFFPSFSLGFVFTEIGGLKDNKALPFGKIRASYSIIANDAFIYGTYNYFEPAFYNDGWTTGVSFPFAQYTSYMNDAGLGNSGLKPEKLYSFEIGADLRFIKNRIGLDFTYYNNKNKDLIIWVPLSGASGYTDKLLNAAEMSNKGVEIVLNTVPIKTKKVEWDIIINFTQNKNNVDKLAEGVENVGLGGFTGAEIRAVVGKPYGSIFGTDWVRDGDGNIIIDNEGNNDPTSPDYNEHYGFPFQSDKEAFLGTVMPKWTMGISTSLKYAGFTLYALLDIKKGGMMWNGTKGIMYALGTHIDTETRGESYVFEGVKGTVGADGNGISTGENNDISVIKDQYWYNGLGGGFGGPSGQFVEKANWVRLREVSLSYTLPHNWLKKSFFKGIDLFVSAKNLFLWTPYTGIDPETNLYGADNAQGIDYFNMPNTRSYNFGLRVNL